MKVLIVIALLTRPFGTRIHTAILFPGRGFLPLPPFSPAFFSEQSIFAHLLVPSFIEQMSEANAPTRQRSRWSTSKGDPYLLYEISGM